MSAIQNVKICETPSEAVRDITDGSKLLVGGEIRSSIKNGISRGRVLDPCLLEVPFFTPDP